MAQRDSLRGLHATVAFPDRLVITGQNYRRLTRERIVKMRLNERELFQMAPIYKSPFETIYHYDYGVLKTLR